jgi:hypothetical protein
MASAFLEGRWLSKSVFCLRDYNHHKFLLDLIAGITDQWRGKKKNAEQRRIDAHFTDSGRGGGLFCKTAHYPGRR